MPFRFQSRFLVALTASILALPYILRAAENAAPADARAFAKRIADRYGLDDFPKVKSIHFIFHIRREDKDTVREWTWFPNEDSVNFKGKDAKGLEIMADYSRKNKWSMGAENVAGIDRFFRDDAYWLLFPLHLAWDEGIDLKLGEKGALSVRYPGDGEHGPGDAYDLIADSDGTIRTWTIHRGDTSAQRFDWARPTDVDGLPISLDRRGPKGFKVWFTRVEVAGLKP